MFHKLQNFVEYADDHFDITHSNAYHTGAGNLFPVSYYLRPPDYLNEDHYNFFFMALSVVQFISTELESSKLRN